MNITLFLYRICQSRFAGFCRRVSRNQTTKSGRTLRRDVRRPKCFDASPLRTTGWCHEFKRRCSERRKRRKRRCSAISCGRSAWTSAQSGWSDVSIGQICITATGCLPHHKMSIGLVTTPINYHHFY